MDTSQERTEPRRPEHLVTIAAEDEEGLRRFVAVLLAAFLARLSVYFFPRTETFEQIVLLNSFKKVILEIPYGDLKLVEQYALTITEGSYPGENFMELLERCGLDKRSWRLKVKPANN